MALIVKDRVLESSTTSGTGSFTLTGAQTGYQSFAAIGDGNNTYYTIQGKNPDGTLTGEWEVGEGGYTAIGTTLSRNTVLSNSLGTTAKIDFSAGDKDVFVTYPSGKALLGTTSAVASTGTGSVVLNNSPTFATDIIVSGILTIGAGANPQFANIAIGNDSLANITTGTGNTAVGETALNALIEGVQNTAVGFAALYSATGTVNPANNNTAMGVAAAYALTTADNSVCIGHFSGANITTGSNNICIGANSGLDTITGINNVYVGTNTPTVVGGTYNNEIVIGSNANGNGTNTTTIGNSSTTNTYLKGAVTAGSIISTRITPRVSTTTSSATPTINTDTTDQYGLTAQAVDITSFTTNLSGTPTDGQKLWIYIVGTAARAITWGASFESSTATLPTTTVTTNRLDIGFVWNAATSKWRCVAVA
jgi:hypothetical protein